MQNAQRFVISNEEYQNFCDRHKNQQSLVPESNEMMKSSYVGFPQIYLVVSTMISLG